MKLPRSYGSRVYLVHLIVVAVSLALIFAGFWRVGVFAIGAAFALAAIARVAISEDHVGMLGVRGRVFDVIWMGTLGTALTALAFIVPGTWQ